METSSVVDVPCGESKAWCYKDQYCIDTWNIRSMNQGKLDVVEQEMATLNFDILGISELKCMEYVNRIHMIIISTTVGKNTL